MRLRRHSKTRRKNLRSKSPDALFLILGSVMIDDSYAFCLVLNLLLTIWFTDREEKRCRVREKELREKDVLIQDNLIRFSSFLSQ